MDNIIFHLSGDKCPSRVTIDKSYESGAKTKIFSEFDGRFVGRREHSDYHINTQTIEME